MTADETTPRARLVRLDLRGFRTIRALDGFALHDVNVLIGPNGAGKSNFISFFRLLSWMMPAPGKLQFHVGRGGGASAFLRGGPTVTPQIEACLTFQTPQGTNEYRFRLFHAARDTLVFAEERFRFRPNTLMTGEANWTDLSAGQREARLIERAEQGNRTAKTIWWLLRDCVVYQFHNTSDTARVRQRWNVEDNRYLKEDAANLAPFLWRLREQRPQYYARIVETLRQVASFFADFVLEPADGTISLQWTERDSDLVFGAHQASDGSIRLMALVALLLQPEEDLPGLVILDEPELGLHPAAIEAVAGLLHGASRHAQVLVATQSPTLLDYFAPEQVVVVEREGSESTFRRLSAGALDRWLDEYTLSELWDKNVLGGRPA